MNDIFKGISFRRYPFRGIYAEVAKDLGVQRQAVQKAARRGNPDTLARIAAKIRERKQLAEELKALLR